MPLYYFQCSKCLKEQRRILTLEESKKEQACDCGYSLRRTPKPPSSRVTETLDNGVMTRKLERLADAERLFAERHEITKKKMTGEE